MSCFVHVFIFTYKISQRVAFPTFLPHINNIIPILLRDKIITPRARPQPRHETFCPVVNSLSSLSDASLEAVLAQFSGDSQTFTFQQEAEVASFYCHKITGQADLENKLNEISVE